MSENLSVLIYTILQARTNRGCAFLFLSCACPWALALTRSCRAAQIGLALRYFLAVFGIAIFMFADMLDLVKKTSGECARDGGEAESSLETFCSLTPLQTYLAMYGIMVSCAPNSLLCCLICLDVLFLTPDPRSS